MGQHRRSPHPASAIRRCATLALVALLAATSAPRAPLAQTPPAPDPVVARRGAITLTAGQVRTMIDNAEPALRHQLQTDPAALDTLVRDRILQLSVLAEAHDHQWDTRAEVLWRAEQARDNAIAQSYVASLTQPDPSYPPESEVQAAYEANRGRLVMPRQYHLAQIYMGVPPGAPAAADAAAQKKLADLRGQIRTGHADFATVARRVSEDHASAPNGGDLGWVREDQMLPAMRGVVAGLPEGSVSEPVRAGDGWHVVKLLATKPAAPATLAEVHPALVNALRQRRMQQSAQAYLNALLQKQPVQLNQIELSGLAKP